MPKLFARVLATLLLAAPATGAAQFPQWSTFPLQYPDARVLPAGRLRLSFLPSYANYNTLFDSAGLTRPLGADFSPDTAAANFLPTLFTVETAVRRITSDAAYRASLGAARINLDADIRRFPLDAELGITDWLTLSARIPVLKTRVQGAFTLDSITGTVGWNQIAAEAANPLARGQIEALLAQLDQAAATLEGRIATGDYGCPSSAQCAQAQALVARARQIRTDLILLTGVLSTDGSPTPPVAPIASSTAGMRIQAEIAAVRSEFQTSFGVSTAIGTLPLPTKRMTAGGVDSLLRDTAFGYAPLLPLETVRIYEFGDAEVGLRIGLLRGDRLRTALHAGVRLPTGTRESNLHVFDAGTGDRQMDIELGLDAAVESAGLGLAVTVRYTLQLADQLTARLTPPERPIAPAAWELPYERDLGDVIQLAAYPSLRLSESFRAYGSVYFFHKGADSYRGGLTVQDPLGGPAVDLSRGTEHRALSYGGGVYYRADRARGSGQMLPIEAGLSYQAAFSGSTRTPKSTVLNLYLRLYYRVFGRPSS
jgi:hypothetical protein